MMLDEIAAVRSRIGVEQDWRVLRDELAELHKRCTTQDEYVAVLEAHRDLVDATDQYFDPAKAAEIRQIAKGEYKLFVNTEAMEGDLINPVLLDRITEREVASGRMAPDDPLRELAASGGAVLGDAAGMDFDRRLGDRIGYAGLIVGAVALFVFNWKIGLACAVAGMGIGWWVNDQRRKEAIAWAHKDREAKGYG